MQRFEAWQYNFTAITRKATEDGIQAFDKEAAIYDRGVAANTDEPEGDRGSDWSQYRPRKSLGYRTPLEYCKQLFNFDFWSVLHFKLEFTRYLRT